MSNGEHIGRAELRAELRSVRLEMRLLIIGLVVVVKLDLPDTITVPAISAVALKTLWGFVTAHYG